MKNVVLTSDDAFNIIYRPMLMIEHRRNWQISKFRFAPMRPRVYLPLAMFSCHFRNTNVVVIHSKHTGVMVLQFIGATLFLINLMHDDGIPNEQLFRTVTINCFKKGTRMFILMRSPLSLPDLNASS